MSVMQDLSEREYAFFEWLSQQQQPVPLKNAAGWLMQDSLQVDFGWGYPYIKCWSIELDLSDFFSKLIDANLISVSRNHIFLTSTPRSVRYVAPYALTKMETELILRETMYFGTNYTHTVSIPCKRDALLSHDGEQWVYGRYRSDCLHHDVYDNAKEPEYKYYFDGEQVWVKQENTWVR